MPAAVSNDSWRLAIQVLADFGIEALNTIMGQLETLLYAVSNLEGQPVD